jgi:hypothetical protein
MKTAIGRGLVAALLLSAGCSSNDNNGSSGSGGTGGGGSAGAGASGTAGTSGKGGSSAGGYAGSGGSMKTGAGGSGMGGSGMVDASGSGGVSAGGHAGSGAGGSGAGGMVGSGAGGYLVRDGGMVDASTGSGGVGGGSGGTGGADGGIGGSDGAPPLPSIPPALEVPSGAMLKIHDRGVGVQIYTCTASGGVDAGVDGGATTYAWVLKAPDAKLFDAANDQVGTHGAGPNWTSTVDGSVVNGTKVVQVDSPLVTAIPWLLLRASSTSGTGVFSDITYVQRLNTMGGKAPATGCDSTMVNTDVRVDYSADYYFYTGGAGAAWLTLPADLPTVLAVPAGAMLKIHDRGIGAQVYTCTSSGGVDGGVDAGLTTYAWVLKAPDAILYDATFAQVGTHGAGPHWTSSDGSTVTGVKLQQANSPRADAIPWLLLKASSTSGTGVFTDIAYVQRLNTAGGTAPVTGCDATTVNTDTRVDYSADYYFFTTSVNDSSIGG